MAGDVLDAAPEVDAAVASVTEPRDKLKSSRKFEGWIKQGAIILPIPGGIKQYKSMVIFRDFIM